MTRNRTIHPPTPSRNVKTLNLIWFQPKEWLIFYYGKDTNVFFSKQPIKMNWDQRIYQFDPRNAWSLWVTIRYDGIEQWN